jgi:hypothetical protein
MKLYLLILLAFVSLNVNAQNFYNGVPVSLPAISHPTNVTSAPFITNQTRTDTMVITGSSLGSSYFGQINGTDSLHPFVVYYDNTNGAGIGIENCHYFKCIGIGSATLNGGGTNGYVKGLVDYVQVSGFLNLDGFNGGWWLKLESGDACGYPDPLDYLNGLANNTIITKRLLHIWFTHNQIGNSDGSHSCGGEGVYAISTGAYGRDPVTCLSNVIYKPLWGGYFHIDSNKIYNCGRSAIQLSGCDLGYNTINGNLIRHTGRELNSTQGSAIRTGYGTNNTTEIAYNDIKYTYLYNLDIETGANVHDNIMDSAGWWDATHKNPQQIPSVVCYALLPNSVLRLQSNTAGANSAQPLTNFAIYGGANYAATGNQICNNTGNVVVLSQPFNYTTDCGAIVDTGCVNKDTTFYRDSYVTGHFDSTFGFKDTTIISLAYVDTLVHTRTKKFVVRYHFNAPRDTVIRYMIRAAYDSVYICSLCQRVDTTICVPIVRTVGYGAFILDGYNSLVTPAQKIHYAKTTLGVSNLREPYVFGNTWGNQQYIDSGINPIPTINTESVSTGPHPLPTNATYIQNYVDSLFKISKPPVAAWLNELGTIEYWDSTGGGVATANRYLSTFNPFISVCHANGVLATDGGITYSIIYSLADYYTRTGKTDSLNYLKTATGVVNFANSAQKIYWKDLYNTLLTGIRNSNADYVQLHFYGDALSVPNKLLTVVSNYIVQQTGKPIVCFETGTNLTGQADFNSFMTEWTKQSPAYLLYYLTPAPTPVTNEGFFLTLKRTIRE